MEENYDSRQDEKKVHDIDFDREKEIRKHKQIRMIMIIMTFICTVLVAAFAGVFLALLERGKSFGDLAESIGYLYQAEVARQDVGETEMPMDSEQSPEQGNAISEDKAAVSSDSVSAVSSNADGEVSENTAEKEESDITSDNSAESDYPKEFQLVDESYFDDALFIGDSRLEGFGLHSGLHATFYTATGFQLHMIDTYKVVKTEDGKKPIFDVLEPEAFKKVYIKVGLNEMGWGTDAMFLQKYTELITKIRALEPDAIIYVHGLIHVTAAKSETDPIHSNEVIDARNEMLKNFAQVEQAYYIDINEVVSDENGALYSDMTADGIHLKAEYMELWKNYLMAHAIVQ